MKTKCIALLVLICLASLSKGQLFQQISEDLIPEPAVPLLKNPHVRKELDLSEMQKMEIAAISNDFTEYFQLLRAAKKEYLKLAIGKTEDEQRAAFNDLKAFAVSENEKLRKRLFEVLDRKQTARFKQLIFQHHLQQTNYELVFKQLGADYVRDEVINLEQERAKALSVQLIRMRFISQIGMLADSFEVNNAHLASLVGRVFDFESGATTNLDLSKVSEKRNVRRTE